MIINCLLAWWMVGIILYPRPYKAVGKAKRGKLAVKQSVNRSISFLTHGAIQMQRLQDDPVYISHIRNSLKMSSLLLLQKSLNIKQLVQMSKENIQNYMLDPKVS